MTERTFADFRCDQMVAVHSLQLREDRFQRNKQIRVKKVRNKVTTMPEIDLQGFVSEAIKDSSQRRNQRSRKEVNI